MDRDSGRTAWRLRRAGSAVLLLVALTTIGGTPSAAAAPASAAGATAVPPDAAAVRGAPPEWTWPIEVPRPILRGYSGPATRYASGHRGIDIAAPVGSAVHSPADGIVSFAGTVVDRPVLSIRHGDGLVSSFEPISAGAAVGTSVVAGQVVGTVAPSSGHCPPGCVHFGVRRDGEYLSPLMLLGGVPRAILLPLDESPQARG
ncbi:MAG: peptidase [Naasia sp.]|jgi:murein DD-endopeptidase MepM/ murein hydrolase activator NlpD|uniref:M23 family metallopeptidase n=1 Tax=Naasia sp. TaxID=2546198 RepID=UPI00262366BF|nr:M23 family metallopeptidase [Naasia sp.]MCU1571129.1 peptidase [Naasia sp.]